MSVSKEFDRITEPQEWIDGLIEEYSPNAHDIDCALQNMGLRIKEIERVLEQAKDILTGYSNNDMMGMGADEMIDEIDRCLKE